VCVVDNSMGITTQNTESNTPKKRGERIDIDIYFMKIAETIKERSTCKKQKVGAVLVKEKHIIATGYNGAPTGIAHCKTCPRLHEDHMAKTSKCRGVHAEENTIIQSALHGVSTKNSTLYSTHFPCISCIKTLINAGVKKIYYKNDYNMNNKIKMNMIKESGIKIKKVY